MREAEANRSWTIWLMGGLEVLLVMAAAVWLLAVPSVFRAYYPVLQPARYTQDAHAIVSWLSTSHRERSLNLALTEGKLGRKEVQHYSDVRQVFRWFPWLTGGLALATVLLWLVSKPRAPQLLSAQGRGLLVWGALLLIIGGFAWWDWKAFFALVHHPLFGDRSWRLPDNAYSLQLFPAVFWRATAAAVVLAPGLLLGSTALLVQLAGHRVKSQRASG